jgi:hypothetical protein
VAQALRLARAIAKENGKTLSPEEEQAVIEKATESARRSAELRKELEAKRVEREAAKKAKQANGALPKDPVAAALGQDLKDELDFQAAVNPFGASALVKANRLGGEKAAKRLEMAGQRRSFNIRSRYANGGGGDFGQRAVGEADAQAFQKYNQDAYYQQKNLRRFDIPKPKLFATGGAVPGVGSQDNVPALLTPGEFVLNQHAVMRAGMGNLQRFNSGGPVYLAGGGQVGSAGGAGGGGIPAEAQQAMSSLANAFSQFAQSANVFNQSSQSLTQAFNVFSGSAGALSEAISSMPRTLSVTGQHSVNVTFNGAEVLAKLMPEMQSYVVDKVKSELARTFKEHLPDAGVPPE